MKAKRIRAMVAAALFAVMMAGSVLVPTVEVRANTPGATISVAGNILTWTVTGAVHFINITFFADGLQFAANNQVSGTLNLTDVLGGVNPRSIVATVAYTDPITLLNRTTNSNTITWTPIAPPLVTAPTLTISGSQASWVAVPTVLNYNIGLVNVQNGQATSHSVSSGTTSYNLNMLVPVLPAVLVPGHQVDVQITANLPGAQQQIGNIVRWTVPGELQLPTPNISISPEGILTWTGGAANHVRLYVGGLVHWESHQSIAQVNLNTINIPAGIQSIRIRFYDPNNAARLSQLSNTVQFNPEGQQLPTPVISVSNTGLLTWVGGTSQNVRVYRNGTQHWSSAARVNNVNLMQLNLPAGAAQIHIRFLHDTNAALNSAPSNQVTFNTANVQLAAPDISVNVAGVLTWTSGGSFNVRVYSGNTQVWTSEGAVSNVDLNAIGLSLGTHQIRIRHLHETNVNLNSAFSNTISFNMQQQQLATPNISIDANALLSWTVGGAQRVRVYANGLPQWTSVAAVSHVNLNTIQLPVGHNNVQIRHLHPTNSSLDSALSNSVNFTVTPIQPTPTPVPTPTPRPPVPTPSPGDLPSDWAQPLVNEAITVGLVPANLVSSFTRATTRAEFTALAVALYETITGEVITGRAYFSDTTDVNVQKMAAVGVVFGMPDGTFAPHQPLTREQAAAMLSRLAEAIGRPLPPAQATFVDNALIGTWARDEVGQMQASGVMTGLPGNMFEPGGAYTREQSIVTILRLYHILRVR